MAHRLPRPWHTLGSPVPSDGHLIDASAPDRASRTSRRIVASIVAVREEARRSSISRGQSFLSRRGRRRYARAIGAGRSRKRAEGGLDRGERGAHSGRADAGAGPSLASPVRLDEQTIEAIASRVVEMLRESSSELDEDRLLTASEVAAWLGVERSWVYEHARELGVISLGDGPSPRLRFDRVKLRQYLDRKELREQAPSRGAPIRRQSRWPEPGQILKARPRREVRKPPA
jgi:hypothetical protein